MEGQSLRSIIGIDFNSLTFEGSSYPLAKNTIGKYANDKCYIDEGFCFTERTLVWQGKQNYTEIAALKKGDFVHSYNHKQKATMRNKIKRLFKRSVDSLTKIVIGGATVLCTPGHNIYANDSYIRAADLSVEDCIYTSSGNYERIDDVSTFDTTATVYNIEVEGNHNYFVSDHNLLVHNNCGWLTLKNTEDLSQSTFNQFTNNLINIGAEVTVAQRKHFYDAINGLTATQRADFLSDFSDNTTALTRFIEDLDLIDSWKVVKNLPENVRLNTTNLESLNKAMKQNGYDADYFETLLKSKSDPQKFLDDYVSKIGVNGKFVDDALENNYASYLTRKAREGKPPRDRADWNHSRDYWLNDSPMARGNAFNETARIEGWYPFDEVTLANGKRVDSYRLPEGGNPGEIVSRKATDLGDIQLSTFESYLSEMKVKYAPGTPINAPKYGNELKGKVLEGDLILELPDGNLSLSNIQDYIDLAKSKGITLRFKPE